MDYQVPSKNGFSQACLVFGILSVVTILTGVLPLFFGSLCILFGILSKKSNAPYDSSAKIGFGCGAAGFTLSLAFMVVITIFLPTFFKDDTFRQQLDDTYEQLYGVDFEGFLEEYLGTDVELDEMFGGEDSVWY